MNIGTNNYQRFCVRSMTEPCDRLHACCDIEICVMFEQIMKCAILDTTSSFEYVRGCVPNNKETKMNGNM